MSNIIRSNKSSSDFIAEINMLKNVIDYNTSHFIFLVLGFIPLKIENKAFSSHLSLY